ncbi:hypothetical protein KMW28_08595 [Flammeovirga yaeyamensis]|uniref:Uncharacterized protein n=1 Tax=Flammeovirga yaeyamensis TaxID=367791 RepID=A0AAX1NAZ1_9BACT|nr:hypothetical protein [Flammeovirga yaeyamensis]MBB3698980.1 hypothetical protein [Flammeovirga yaeyamensis]NMF36414.1 hypothetical protein [Flammeovirga yaeyamensis]QWG03626.1 hypothetical protein KMW28_08595 [Flammeovirga yaeyamensis]
MAKSNQLLINKLREAAENITSGDYMWGHPGKCNCGHLVQAITPMNSKDIYQTAQRQKLDEWSEFANDYCPASGMPVDNMIDTLLDIGLEVDDIPHLEYLSNKKILKALPGGFRYLQKGNREDAAEYMQTWANVLEEELV